MFSININYLDTANFALVHNGLKLCDSLELQNGDGMTDEDLHDVLVTCTGEWMVDTESAVIDVVGKGKSMRLGDFSILPNAGKMIDMTERVQTTFTIVAYKDAGTKEGRTEIFRKECPLTLMAYDQWLGTQYLPQALASFVTPNSPLVQKVVVRAASHLQELTDSSAFDAYQSRNPNVVRKQVAAIFGALHEEGLVYRALPASFESVGQRVTLPEQVLQTKLGNCIELTLLLCSVLESVGINCGVVIIRGHAFLGVWLNDDECCSYSVCDDYAYIEKQCSRGIDNMMVLESTMLTQDGASFEIAQSVAREKLSVSEDFSMYIDIHRCRLEQFLPLPMRRQVGDGWQIDETEGLDYSEADIRVVEHSPYDLTRYATAQRTLTRLDIWERKLLDFSLRNTLLNLYLRKRAVQFITFDIHKIEDRMQDGEEFCIEAKPANARAYDGTERLMLSKQMEQHYDLVTEDIAHHVLHTNHTESETTDILKNIYRSARNAIEETGANSLFLAIGVLRWYETDQSETARYAPILLLPVDMVYKKGKYYIRTREEDIMLNVTLTEFIRQNYDITIPGIDVLPKDEHGVDVSLIFAIIRDALKNQRRWNVEEECILGVFSFSKYLMWNDVHNHRDQLLESPVVKSLVDQKLSWQPTPLVSSLRQHDKALRPEQLALPVAVDSSQMAAVLEAGLGHSFILYGPPGTGKSQTITNLIANALFQGKRVLFVAEKMAALSVVQKRLAKIGLDPFCLEMHSNKVAKRHILDQLHKAISVTHIKSPQDYQSTADYLYGQRMKLIGYMEALHHRDEADGLSLYDCILHYESIHDQVIEGWQSNPTLDAGLTATTLPEYEHLLGGRLAAMLNLVGQPSQHPLLGLTVGADYMKGEVNLDAQLAEAIALVDRCIKEYASLAEARDKRFALLKDNKETIFSLSGKQLYDEWRMIRAKWFLPRFFAKRSFVNRLRAYNTYLVAQDVDQLIDSLMDYQSRHAVVQQLHDVMGQYCGAQYDVDVMPEMEQLTALQAKLARWKGNLHQVRDWYHWCEYRNELTSKGLSTVVDMLETATYTVDEISGPLFKSYFMSKARAKMMASAELRVFEGLLFDEQVAQYKKWTDDFQLLSQKELYARLARQIPRVTDSIDSSSEIGLLNRNISNGGRGTSLRDLLDQIPTLLPRLCPCMLMSPMSVAQYLDLGQEKFDLVIFDEASQMPTSEAVGAIARGKSLIVVGDPKQMPPTSFFSSTNVEEDEADIDDMESILEDCRTLDIPSLQLNWHYRSRHESLIAFSNSEYYDGSLITFPSVDDKTTKVRHVPVDGVYDKGGKRSNKAEAEAIVEEIASRLKDKSQADKSIGVIAFSVVQQNLIEDILQDRLDSDKQLREAADAMYEPIFVKNLENVQGDERDVILFSIGYGPDKTGNVSMNFGPLNNAGGERRLNVAVSRARHEMLVFSTLRSSQIDLRRSKAKGVEGLKHFLEYAEQQLLTVTESSAYRSKDAIIATQIADALKERGYVTTIGVGRSQFKIDVALSRKETPDVYELGILLDGEKYRDTQTTRDREIVQPSVLTGLGWKVMRVWAVDWINNPRRVVNRIVERLEQQEEQQASAPAQRFDISNEAVAEVETCCRDYEKYTLSTSKALAMTDASLIGNIVSVEQPITYGYLCRRIVALRGMSRVTQTLQRSVHDLCKALYHTETDRDSFVIWKHRSDSESYQYYRKDDEREVQDIPMVEIKNVIIEAAREQFAINTDALSLIAAKKLGFTRRGANVDNALNEAVSLLVAEGRVVVNEGKINLP